MRADGFGGHAVGGLPVGTVAGVEIELAVHIDGARQHFCWTSRLGQHHLVGRRRRGVDTHSGGRYNQEFGGLFRAVVERDEISGDADVGSKGEFDERGGGAGLNVEAAQSLPVEIEIGSTRGWSGVGVRRGFANRYGRVGGGCLRQRRVANLNGADGGFAGTGRKQGHCSQYQRKSHPVLVYNLATIGVV